MFSVFEVVAHEDCPDEQWETVVNSIRLGLWHGLNIGKIQIEYRKLLVEIRGPVSPKLVEALKKELYVDEVTIHRSSYIQETSPNTTSVRYIA